ncbi:S-adenosylhomocysteine hydrolase [Photobacterium aquae]|uniref:S-adenosylhomocysteine hydrolase n=1 Tax=Photobacterium aquae TaxID=1195763 RepID=A0A0J1JT64_9GAMM|nr:phage protein [Photobacterium aquae]KLV05472.1 S-adenosylhomocysteine hydrolase [Photobacterium aquae]
MLHLPFVRMFWRQFESISEGAAWFNVKDITVKRWLTGQINVNPMAEKLLIIRARGYFPDDTRWQGFRVCERRCIIITPENRVFSPKELDGWVLRNDEYHALKRLYELDYIPVRSNVVTPLPFRGGRRINAPLHETISKEKKKAYRKYQEKVAKRRNAT